MYSAGTHMQYPQQFRYPKAKTSSNEGIRCDVCNISVRGQDQFSSHVAGAKHHKKVKEQENSRKVEETPYLKYEESTGGYSCTICKVTLNSSSVAMFHVLGSRHQESIKALATGETTESGVVAMETSDGNNTTELFKTDQYWQPDFGGVVPNAGLPTGFGSKMVPVTGNAKPIRPNFNRNPQVRPLMSPTFRYQVKPLASSFVSKYTTHTVEASVSTEMILGPRPRSQPNAGPKAQAFPCLACNIVTNSETQLQAHLSSEKHKNRLGIINSGANGPQPIAPPPVSASALRCESCNISVNSQVQLEQHLQSPKHRNKLKMRYQPY